MENSILAREAKSIWAGCKNIDVRTAVRRAFLNHRSTSWSPKQFEPVCDLVCAELHVELGTTLEKMQSARDHSEE